MGGELIDNKQEDKQEGDQVLRVDDLIGASREEVDGYRSKNDSGENDLSRTDGWKTLKNGFYGDDYTRKKNSTD